MLLFLLILGCAILVLTVGVAAAKAPVGYQDDTGFHFGSDWSRN